MTTFLFTFNDIGFSTAKLQISHFGVVSKCCRNAWKEGGTGDVAPDRAPLAAGLVFAGLPLLGFEFGVLCSMISTSSSSSWGRFNGKNVCFSFGLKNHLGFGVRFPPLRKCSEMGS